MTIVSLSEFVNQGKCPRELIEDYMLSKTQMDQNIAAESLVKIDYPMNNRCVPIYLKK